MVIWIIWLIVAIAVIAAKYYTARTAIRMRVNLSKRGAHLSASKAEAKLIKSRLEIARRNRMTTQRRIVETREQIEKLRPELKELEEIEDREMQVAKYLVETVKESKGR